jgi:hypothetical protein
MRDESVAPAEVTPGTDFCDSYLSPECCRKGRSELSLEQAKESGEQRVEPALKGREVGDLFVVIATYNEKENVKSLIEKILALEPPFHVLIVDDNSPDGTGRIVQQLADENNRVHLLARPAKLGYGSAPVRCSAWMPTIRTILSSFPASPSVSKKTTLWSGRAMWEGFGF